MGNQLKKYIEKNEKHIKRLKLEAKNVANVVQQERIFREYVETRVEET